MISPPATPPELIRSATMLDPALPDRWNTTTALAELSSETLGRDSKAVLAVTVLAPSRPPEAL